MAADADREARFAAFVAEHRDRAVGLAWRLLSGDAAAAEDVVQEAFVRAYRALGGFREEARLSTWFYRILMNEVQRYRRWSFLRERRSGPLDAEPLDPAAPEAGDPALRARIARAIDRLPRGQREAFVLVHLEGFSVRDAALVSGRAIGTIKSHLHRGLRALRSELSDLEPCGAAPSRREAAS